MKRIGFVGLGIMGSGMAASLLGKGYPLTVWNRTRSRCAPLVEKGATEAPDLASVAAASQLIISMLRDDAVVRRVVKEGLLPHAAPGTTLIDMSTVTPRMCRELAAAAGSQGCQLLDAPVMGSKEAAAGGQLIIMVGGDAQILEAHFDVLSAMGQKVIHVGPNGSSAFLKLACNQLVAGVMAAIGEGLELAARGGVDRQTAVDTFVATLARVAGLKHAKIAERDWSTHFALELMLKDLNQALEAADDVRLPMPVLAAVREAYQRVNEQGKGELDFSVVADPG
jgi:3-hydroxyisobutyrate dehydrogenase